MIVFTAFFFLQIIIFSFFLGGLIGVVQVGYVRHFFCGLHSSDLYACSSTCMRMHLLQKSGGGIGLANLLSQFINSRRKLVYFCLCIIYEKLHRATVVCATLCLLVFFDDYSAVLIPGNSLRSVCHSPTTH